MNGAHFIESLKELGHTNTKGVEAESFDWIFEHEQALPFLEWFCYNLGSANVLASDELKEYEDLQKERHILDGDQLLEALKRTEQNDGKALLPSEEELREDIESLEQEVVTTKRWKEQLIQQRNQLSIHHTSLGHRNAQLGKLGRKAKQDLVQHLQKNLSDNDAYNTCLTNLTTSVGELGELYNMTAVSNQRASSQNASFLSQIDLEEYHQAESKFTSELNKFTKKQFFEGIAEMAGQNEGQRYDILEISDPSSLLIRGENEKVNMADCKELARLQAIYPKSEQQRINAVVQEQCLSTLWNYAEDQCHSLRSNPYPCDLGGLSQRLQEKQKVVENLKRESATLAKHHVPELLRDSASSQVNRILQGDYDLKIARQDYFTSNQDRVLDQLIVQRSRYEFLTMAYELEARNHSDTHRLLTAISMELKKTLSDFAGREEMMKQNPGHASHKYQRDIVDSRDLFMTGLHEILEKTSNDQDHQRQIFLKYASLQDVANNIHEDVSAARSGVATLSTVKDQRLADLEEQLKIYENVLYSGSSTSKGLPQLSPPQLVNVMTRLEAMLSRLETAIKDTISDTEQKKKVLKSDPFQAMERNLFINFMNDPTKLRQMVDGIEARCEANRVSSEKH